MAEVDGPQRGRAHAPADGAGRARQVVELHRAARRATGHVLDVNPAALIAGGVDRSEVIGLPLWTTPWWAGAGDRRRARALERRDRRRRRGPLRALRRRRADRGRRPRPPARWTCCCARCAAATAGWRSSSPRAGTITDRKRVEQRLARQNAELSALTQRLARVHDYRERLLGELSHDLRAPLQVVITRSEQLLRSAAATEVRARSSSTSASPRWARSSRSTTCSSRSRPTTARRGSTLVDADLAQAVRTVAEQFEPLAADREIELDDRRRRTRSPPASTSSA